MSLLALTFDQMRSIQEHVFIILRQRQACAGRFQEETVGNRTGPITKCVASFNVYTPEEDPELQMEVYTRSPEQNELLGLDQMNVD